ncbi:hypothetical protein [Vibrio agarivorans]|uniref:Type 4 secretion system PilS N-terminal domain-containing protein n=1 Tax=Vibrio agarivorans TaxID=153622 RepID=A0ABT7Y7E1_9VIBR|nr:hypothetical protein [Vibrio agarivorans]MDN2483972.1 hypothetical protein [Vibrio agarivorans]
MTTQLDATEASVVELNNEVVSEAPRKLEPGESRLHLTGYGKKQRGAMSLIDMGLMVVFLIGGIMLVMRLVPSIQHSMNMMSLNSQVSDIRQGALSWKGQRTNFAGINLTTLCSDNYVTDTVCGTTGDGAAANPWGGNITVTDNSNQSLIDVTFSSLDPNRVNQIADSLASSTADACASRDNCDTISVSTDSVVVTL